MPLDALRLAIEGSDWDAFIRLDEVGWPAIARAMCVHRPDEKMRKRFHSSWITHGARIRSGVEDDRLLATALRAWLPSYEGPDLHLYRGESERRASAGRLGMCWTPDRDVAEMFGAGLHAMFPGGGVLLAAEIPSQAVISGPNEHSRHLGEDEYVADPFAILEWKVLRHFPMIR